MVRLFVANGALALLSLLLALLTHLPVFRWLTILLCLSIIGLFAYLHRGLLPNEGRFALPGLQAQVEIHIDDQGVPHVYARSLADLYRAQGFITARDRLFAMELTRRAAAGRLSEVLGRRMLPADRLMRTLAFRRRAEADLPTLDHATREALEAYAEGVNACLRNLTLPVEFSLLKFRPEPWTAADCLAVARYAACAYGADWPAAMVRARLLQAVGAEAAAELAWPAGARTDLWPAGDPPPAALDDLLKDALSSLQEAWELLSWIPAGSSGTAWAITGAKTESGQPLLAADLLQPPTATARWYQIHLVGPEGLDVAGASLPGVPGVFCGRNRALAWGLASRPSQPESLLFEPCPAEAGEVVQETIPVRGSLKPETHEVLITPRGPAIARTEGGALILRWEALQFAGALTSILALNRAQSVAECQQALQHYQGPAVSILVACRDGTTARIRAGKGAAGEVVTDPPEGYLLPEAEEYTAEAYRAQRIAERFHGAPAVTAEKLRDFLKDDVNLRARTLLKPLLAAVQQGLQAGTHPEDLSDLERRALLMLSGWEGSEEPDAPQPALWHQWFQFLTEEIFRPRMGRALYDQFTDFGQADVQTDRLIRAAAAGQPSRWLEPEGEQSLSRIALRSFRRAVALLAAKQGPRPDRWRWGREHPVAFPHPLASQSRIARLLLGLGPHPAGGSNLTMSGRGYDAFTPFRVSLAPTWRQVVDLADPDGFWLSIVPGQSNHPLSTHFSDQLVPWLKGEYQPALFRHGIIRQLSSLTLLP
ncbi:MAG TPA: penicillin acylase family protein [Symbiobacteriaceae bacterium]